MTRALRRPRRPDASASESAERRAVLLSTLGVPFDPEAARLAVDSAVESGRPLVVANVVELPPLGMSVNMRYDQLDDPPELADALRAPAELARALGVQVERLRVRSLRPIAALLELVEERRPAILVFGPDRSKLRRRKYRRAARAVRDRVQCLIWLAE